MDRKLLLKMAGSFVAVMLMVFVTIRLIDREQAQQVSQLDAIVEAGFRTDSQTKRQLPSIELPVVGRPVSDFQLPASDHAYSVYSDDELRAMSVSDPDAAVLLARRTDNDDAAELLYERAVALSGSPDPLFEWLFNRHSRAGARTGGELESLESTETAYEIALTTSKIVDWPDGVQRYANELLAEGVDLAPIKQRADRRFDRLTRERQALLGEGWQS